MMRASSIAHRLVNEARRAQGEHGVSRYTHCMRRTVDAFEQFGINIHADFFLFSAGAAPSGSAARLLQQAVPPAARQVHPK